MLFVAEARMDVVFVVVKNSIATPHKSKSLKLMLINEPPIIVSYGVME